MISNSAYIKKANKSQKVVKEEFAKMIAKFRIGVVPLFA
jgi:hypothetical protein